MNNITPQFISKQDLASLLGISGATVLRLEKKGELPPAWRPTNGITQYDIQKCREYIERNSTSASA